MKPFNAVVIGVFVVLGLLGIAVIATFTGGNSQAIGTVVVWGPVPTEIVGSHIDAMKIARDDFGDVSYVEIPESTFISELVEAIAANRGPDLVVLPLEYVVEHGDKLQSIPYSSVSRREFQDTFIEAGEVLLADSGIAGLPYIIDPLVLYWNRTLFSGASLARPPRYWDEVSTYAASLTVQNQAGTLSQSAIALGEWNNVAGAKEILLSLLRQLGNSVVTKTEGSLVSVLTATQEGSFSSAESAFRYFTEFADPIKENYSWNRSQIYSRDAFLGGRLAMYIGFASELPGLREANPNLNFDVALIPSARGAGSSVAAKGYALAIPRGSVNPGGALSVANVLSGNEAQTALASTLSVPSVRRDLLSVSPEDPYAGVLRDAALKSFVFLDPNPTETTAIFKRIIDNISSGNLRVKEAVNAADNELREVLRVR